MEPILRFLGSPARAGALAATLLVSLCTVACKKTSDASQKNFVAAMGNKNRHLVVWPAYAAADAKAFIEAVSTSRSFQEMSALASKPEFAAFLAPELCWYGRDVASGSDPVDPAKRTVLTGEDLRTVYTRKDPALSTTRSVSCPALMKAMADNPKLANLAMRLQQKAQTAGVKDPCTYLLYVLTPQLGAQLFAGLQSKGLVSAQEGGLP